MDPAAQFRDGERVDSSTGTAERLDDVKRDRSRCRRAETTAARRAATVAARPVGAFSTGVSVDWGLSQRPARVDCRLSYTTGQATIARSAIVACTVKYGKRSPFLLISQQLHCVSKKFPPFNCL